MFTIKICGVTNVEDALAAARAGADAVGLNFYAGSPRCLPIDRAYHIAAAVPANVAKVGVFVDASADTICEMYDALGLDFAQLHGDEPAELLAALDGRRAMKAFRVTNDLKAVAAYLEQCRALGRLPDAVLLDGYRPGQLGGTGATADWELIARERDALGNVPVVLAGGLTADNVAAAIHRLGPAAVDTASGVESSLGKKDHAAIERFVGEARQAFANRR